MKTFQQRFYTISLLLVVNEFETTDPTYLKVSTAILASLAPLVMGLWFITRQLNHLSYHLLHLKQCTLYLTEIFYCLLSLNTVPPFYHYA